MVERFTELVNQSPLANRVFINHCIDVYTLLKKQNESEEVCNAGLYHSIYGTSYLNVTLQTIENDRDLIKKEIGEYAEKLVYEMCSLKDREFDIVTGNFNWDNQTLSDIVKICRANLITLNSDNYCIELYNIILDSLSRGVNPFLENSMRGDIKIIDNLLPYQYQMRLFDFTVKSKYTTNHKSNRYGKDKISTRRFASVMDKDDFSRSKLFPYIKKIANQIGQDLFITDCYIGHYSKATSSDCHVDSCTENQISILIYPNNEWQDLWAGDIKFYSEDSPFHKLVDFKPGRVVVFDSTIKHKVMPLSSLAEADRFSIAIKTCTFLGLSDYFRTEGSSFEYLIHIPCT